MNTKRLLVGIAVAGLARVLVAQEPLMRSPNPTPPGTNPAATPANRPTAAPGVTLTPMLPSRTTPNPTPGVPSRPTPPAR